MASKAKAAPTRRVVASERFEAGDLVRSLSPSRHVFEVEAVKWDEAEGAQGILGPAPASLGRASVWYDARRFELVRKRKGKVT
jgi:hypothetical protein